MAIPPARVIFAPMVIAPALAMLPIVKALPVVVALIASLKVTAKLVELPITDRFPFASALTITDARMFAVPDTESTLPEILQLVPKVPVCPVEEMVKF